ncbi:MAG: DUF4252 domain-containing protein [Ignavibacteria bacterium]|nr:DUF4252 domain-containing protein [Ignavibacteria bacterium]
MKTKIFLLPILFLFLFLNGCIGINKEFAEIRNKVLNNLDDDFRSEYQFSIGSVGITVSSWFVDAAADEDLPAEILEDVSSVQVGVYKKIRSAGSPSITTLRELENEMLQKGWKSIVKTCDGNELNSIYIRSNSNEMLDRLFMISLNDEELILVEVEGDLKEVIATVIRDKRLNIKT